MPSAAEQMAANLSWGSFGKAKDLQRRIFYALGLLIVYRIGTYIPVPGIDASQLRSFFEQANSGIGGMLNMFTAKGVVLWLRCSSMPSLSIGNSAQPLWNSSGFHVQAEGDVPRSEDRRSYKVVTWGDAAFGGDSLQVAWHGAAPCPP